MADEAGQPRKKISRWTIAGFLFLGLVLVSMLAPEPEPEAVSEAPAMAEAAPPAQRPTPAQRPARAPREQVTARAVRDAFDANQIAAEARFAALPLRVSGVITSVTTDILGDPVVSVDAGDYRIAMISLAERDLAKAAALKAGESVSADCAGASSTLGTVMFTDCRL